jgi:RNA polymerase sigma factor (TIGR02999 family)
MVQPSHPAGSDPADGDPFESSYGELRQLARYLMSAQPAALTLQATALVSEAFIRLAEDDRYGSRKGRWHNRRHFVNAVTLAMRHTLADHARSRQARKRGGQWRRVRLEDIRRGTADAFPIERVDDLQRCLERLEGHNARCAEVLRLRFFAGLTIEQTASVMEISPATVKNDWKYARAWLMAALEPESAP